MKSQLDRIELQLDALQNLLKQQQKDISKIQKWIAAKERKPRLLQATANITAPSEYLEYEDMTIKLDAKTWMDVRKGKQITLKGNGWGVHEDDLYQDYWSFNESKLNSLRVYFPDPDNDDDLYTDVIFDGQLSGCDIEETPVKRTKQAKPL